jgi:LacI family transcriptional regulator
MMTKIKNVLVLIETSREYGRSLIKGILEYCKLSPNWKIELHAPFYTKQSHIAIYKKSIERGLYDGIIGHIKKTDDFNFIMDSKTPAILQSIYTHIDGEILNVDNTGIGHCAAEFFIEKGIKNFAFFGCKKLCFSNERFRGFSDKLNPNISYEFSTGIDIRPTKIRTERIGDWIKKLPKPIGILACNDDWAKILNEVCIQNEIKVPQEVAILGVDNDEIACKTTWPYISSISLNTEKAGFEAASLLDKMMTAKRQYKKVVSVGPIYIKERQSTDITITRDPVVSMALEYIKANIDKPIQVTDILDHVLVSRRCLHNKFIKNLGCPVLSQMRKMQIERVARLLLQTDISITNISNQSGFTSTNLSRIFKKYKGTCPSNYRNSYKL